MKTNPYKKLLLTMAISFFVMYAVMFLNVDEASDIYLSPNRLYMSLLMVSPMAITMITLMKHMYADRSKNLIVTISAVAVFALSLVCLRTQAFISDKQYMRGMIPHHSSAIMTSNNASLRDRRVQVLADSIGKSQREEIRLMKKLLEETE